MMLRIKHIGLGVQGMDIRFDDGSVTLEPLTGDEAAKVFRAVHQAQFGFSYDRDRALVTVNIGNGDAASIASRLLHVVASMKGKQPEDVFCP